MFAAADHEFMGKALQLAERGLFTTTPNPRVGCLVVKDGTVIATGSPPLPKGASPSTPWSSRKRIYRFVPVGLIDPSG